MKKVLSIVLALLMTFGMASFAFAADAKITGAILPIDTYASYDVNSVAPGQKIEMPLTADMFKWSDGVAGVAKAPVTRQQISRGSVRVTVSGSSTASVKDISIKYLKPTVTGGKETAVVVVEFVKPYVGTTPRSFDFSIFLTIGSRQADSRVRMEGFLENPVKSIGSGDNYVQLASGTVLEARASVRNIEIDVEKITIKTNVYNGQKYYISVDDQWYTEDDRILTKYPSIYEILRLQTVNIKKAGKYIDLGAYDGYVYGKDGSFLGKTTSLVEYSDIYYLSDSDLGKSITAAGGVPGGGGSTKPDTKPDENSGNSGTGNGNSGGGSETITTGTVSKTEAISATNAAIATARAKGSKVAVVNVRNRAAITAEALKAINSSAAGAGMSAQLQADTVEGKAVAGRIVLFPDKAANITSDIKLGSHTVGAQVDKTTAVFNKTFKNKLVVFSCDQNGSFGMAVQVIAKVNLSSMNKSNIYMYSYNRSTGKYYAIQNPNASIDSAGYLRFTTTLAGDIIISDGPLARK